MLLCIFVLFRLYFPRLRMSVVFFNYVVLRKILILKYPGFKQSNKSFKKELKKTGRAKCYTSNEEQQSVVSACLNKFMLKKE